MYTSGKSPSEEISVSVVIPCYNQGEFILDAISSVQSCSEPVWEAIVVNDGSTDPVTQKVLTYLKNSGYQVVDQSNQGLAQARNKGIELAKGPYILPLDADNKIRGDYITKAIAILDRHPDVGVVYGDAELFGDQTGVRSVPDFDLNRMLRGNYIDACAVFRKVLWQQCGGYDPKIPKKLGYEDWDFWLSAAEKGWRFYHIPEVLFDYRLRSDSMVSFCNIPENRKQLLRYIATKHIGLYATNFANIWADKEFAYLTEKARAESLLGQLEQTEAELAKSGEQLLEAQAQWMGELQRAQTQLQQAEAQWVAQQQRAQLQLQQTQAALLGAQAELEQSQSRLEQTQVALQAELKRSQSQLQQAQQKHIGLQGELLKARSEAQQIRAELEQTQTQLQQSQTQLQQSQTQLQQSQTGWEGELARWQEELQEKQSALEASQAALDAIRTSKFWKLRTQWFKLKKVMGLGADA
ncbi:glycosyltransferase [Kamptonema formosum]|uniref:glycosyltransferase n=1 Tax=Kamptonema formosum TaxID=331992 RepID=UPI00047781F4|nr:glycosyltransferase [Oscillatoria sp. PCC 10802]